MPKIAILLKGIFYMPFYAPKHRLIDYRLCFPTFKSFFQNHEVDYYISIYKNQLEDDIIRDYKPIAHVFRPFIKAMSVFQGNNMSILKVLELFNHVSTLKKKQYDYIILTRPDITFDSTLKFEDIKLPINHDSMQIMQLTNRNGFCEDNFMVVGQNVLPLYRDLIKKRITECHHAVLRRFSRLYPKKVRFYNYLNFHITPGLCSFYRLIKINAPVPTCIPTSSNPNPTPNPTPTSTSINPIPTSISTSIPNPTLNPTPISVHISQPVKELVKEL